MTKQQGVILDEESFNPGDLKMDGLISLLDSWQRYNATPSNKRLERLQNATIAIANKVVFDADLLKQLPKLKLILLTATGMDNIDRDYCDAHGIAYKNVTDYCTASVSQHVSRDILSFLVKGFVTTFAPIIKSGAFSAIICNSVNLGMRAVAIDSARSVADGELLSDPLVSVSFLGDV